MYSRRPASCSCQPPSSTLATVKQWLASPPSRAGIRGALFREWPACKLMSCTPKPPRTGHKKQTQKKARSGFALPLQKTLKENNRLNCFSLVFGFAFIPKFFEYLLCSLLKNFWSVNFLHHKHGFQKV